MIKQSLKNEIFLFGNEVNSRKPLIPVTHIFFFSSINLTDAIKWPPFYLPEDTCDIFPQYSYED